MSSFSLHIATDNAAFEVNPTKEVARIMANVASAMRAGQTGEDGTVRDINGNTCGRWFWTDRCATHDDAAALDLIENAITKNENFAPKAVTELLERIVDGMRLTGRDRAGSYPDYEEGDDSE